MYRDTLWQRKWIVAFFYATLVAKWVNALVSNCGACCWFHSVNAFVVHSGLDTHVYNKQRKKNVTNTANCLQFWSYLQNKKDLFNGDLIIMVWHKELE